MIDRVAGQATVALEQGHGVDFCCRRGQGLARRRVRRRLHLGIARLGTAVGHRQVGADNAHLPIADGRTVHVLHLARFCSPLRQGQARRLEADVIGRMAGGTFLLRQWIARQRTGLERRRFGRQGDRQGCCAGHGSQTKLRRAQQGGHGFHAGLLRRRSRGWFPRRGGGSHRGSSRLAAVASRPHCCWRAPSTQWRPCCER
ncbi:hypothetical protein PS833_06682 [Pseudomonas fluorescens]|uniref:Uncharacterized protein n=1 Tax=Pseudomonas fluorescens TaxID=294 RepID=A0A5E7G4K8_PSEFL|nr:hypothetical protein PS833_06682 [Pseudomonas fluorescens]